MRTFCIILLFISFITSAHFINTTEDLLAANSFVRSEQAFSFSSKQKEHEIILNWDILDGYYLYQDKLSINAQNIDIVNFELADGTPHNDEFFGDVYIYTGSLFAKIILQDWHPDATITVSYQGCAKVGFCYPPETKIIKIDKFNNANIPSTINAQKSIFSYFNLSETQYAKHLSNNTLTIVLFFFLGIALAFTPCVFPMYPILTSIILGQSKLNQKRAFSLSFIYVQGMALTYTLLGLVVASLGTQFQGAMQHPYILIIFSILFILLSASMFGLYTLQLPSNMQAWLNNLSNKQKGGNSFGVFVMGAISGLVCSPCITAPLSGVLLYVSQSGDLLIGAVTLYVLAMGMGIPLILVAVFGNKILPKAGFWVEQTKIFFGFILLTAPLFLLERLITPSLANTLWALLGIATSSWLYHIKNKYQTNWIKSFIGVVAILGLTTSTFIILNSNFRKTPIIANKHEKLSFIKINNLNELTAQLEIAKLSGKAIMLDFYADWCVACKEFEKYTFTDSLVQEKFQKFTLLQADVTKNTAQDIELFNHLKVFGLPTIEFWNANGEHLPEIRITGLLPAKEFAQYLEQVK